MKSYYFKKYLNWDWTEEIVNTFLNSFTKFDAHNIDVRNQEYIGIYGPTQVGKTTFILSFIGINDKYMESLSAALRGKQGYGKSSTVTATMYERIESENFEIIHPDKTISKADSFEELSQCLQKFREEVTGSQYDYLEEMTIKIPDKYFYSSNVETKDLVIVDLPGDDSKDSDEAVHVDQILDKYLLLCRTIIVMELGYKLNSLHQITSEAIKNWKDYPDRFIISFTQGITNRDVKKEIDDKILTSNEEILEKYKKDLEADVEEGKDIYNIISFFELGDSLSHIKETNLKLYSKVKDWNQDNFRRVLERIRKNDSPEFRIKNLSTIINNIEQMKKDELDSLNNDLEYIKKQINLRKELLDSSNKVLLYKKEKLESSNQAWEEIKELIKYKNIENYIQERYETWEKLPGKNRYAELKDVAIRFTVELRGFLRNIQDGLNRYTDKLQKAKSEVIFKEVYDYLDGYYFGAHKTIFGNTSLEDFLYEIREIKANVKIPYLKLVSLVKKEYKKDNEYIELHIHKLRDDLKSKKYKLDQSLNKKKKIEQEIIASKEGWQEEADKVKLLNNVILNEYSKNIIRLRNELRECANKNDKLMIFLLMKVITNQIERVLISE